MVVDPTEPQLSTTGRYGGPLVASTRDDDGRRFDGAPARDNGRRYGGPLGTGVGGVWATAAGPPTVIVTAGVFNVF